MEIVMAVVVAVLVGLGLGIGFVAALGRSRRATTASVGEEMRRALDAVATQQRAEMEAERRLSGEVLEGKKSLIDQQLGTMNHKLDQVSSLMQELEADRERKFGELSEQLQLHGDGVTSLLQTTQSLREALSSTKARGQWGERMAEDVLRLAGFVENVNYRKQKALADSRGVPDFTFLLPNDLLLHMDVKFPLDNYLRACDASSELERRRHQEAFLRDVKARVRDLASRAYVDAGGGTVDFVLLFIPNEQLYAYIHEHDGEILDDAVRQRVVFCSPLTLFAVLALIRQMVESFALARTSDEILSLLGQFSEQWRKFVGQMDKVGQRIESAGKEYEALVGTRARMLERPLHKIDAIRAQRDPELALLDVEDDDPQPPLALGDRAS